MSGAGKSTLADLIPRFYEPESGSIKIDDIDIKKFSTSSLRSLMGIVTQDTILFNTSIIENISYGIKNHSIEQIINASKAANSHEFIEKLPDGYKTILDEKGCNLSGGQRQRISIARAILKNPPIIILDEATSNLDTESENKVKLAFSKLVKDRTVIIIAHRLSTINDVDKIIVLKDGSIIENGSHSELMENNNEYKKLYNLQFNN